VEANSYYVKAPYLIDRRRELLKPPAGAHCTIELEACGVCRSDVIWAAQRATEWQKIGHEFGGRILEVGEGVQEFKVGQRVAVRNAAVCGRCEACLGGRPRACTSLLVNKSGHDDYFIADERSLVDASSLDAPLLGLVEPVGVALSVLETARVRAGHTVVIYGLGAIGLLAGYLLSQIGGTRVIGIARTSSRFDLAREFGIRECWETAEVVENHKVRDFADRILMFAPPASLEGAMALLAPEGKVVLVGVNEATPSLQAAFDFEQLIFKRASLLGAFECPNLHFEAAVKQLSTHGDQLRKLIANEVPLSELGNLLKSMQDRSESQGKVILIP
jgi:threonine dehydrogenase-like Zn-dependent dehydrogenase